MSAGGPPRRDRTHVIPDLDLSIVKDIGAQAAPVYERAQNRPRRVVLDHAARLAQPLPLAAYRSDHELASDQPIEGDTARDHVATVFIRP